MELIENPTERITAITDLMMAIVAIIGLFKIYGRDDLVIWKVRLWLTIYVLFIGAAIAGTFYHGMALPTATLKWIWGAIFLQLGMMVALFVVAVAFDLRGIVFARRLLPVMVLTGLSFFAYSLLQGQDYGLFIMYEALALLSALLGYSYLAWKKFPGGLYMAIAVFITIIAAAVQATEAISFAPAIPFDHNSAYHVIQIIGIYFLTTGVLKSKVQ
jgi:hypothetical protein